MEKDNIFEIDEFVRNVKLPISEREHEILKGLEVSAIGIAEILSYKKQGTTHIRVKDDGFGLSLQPVINPIEPKKKYYFVTFIRPGDSTPSNFRNAAINQDPVLWMIEYNKKHVNNQITIVFYDEIDKETFDKINPYIIK